MTKKRLVEKLLQENKGATHVTSPGSTGNKPRGRMDGVHLVTKDEMIQEATLLILSATRIEYAKRFKHSSTSASNSGGNLQASFLDSGLAGGAQTGAANSSQLDLQFESKTHPCVAAKNRDALEMRMIRFTAIKQRQ